MTRKGNAADARRRARGEGVAMNAFNVNATTRLGAIEIEPGVWRLTEERRERGQWEFHRYVTEIETFATILEASAFAIAEAKRRRDAIKATMTKADWVKMHYPAGFLQEVPRAFLPGRLPPGWEIRRVSVFDKARNTQLEMDQFYRDEDGLRVSMRYGRLADKREWLTVNASYADETPDWETMCEIKNLFIGEQRHALQVHPRRSEYINYSAHMLHIITPLNGWTLPDFRPLL